MTNLSDGTTTENVSVDGTLTLLNTADSSYGGTETPFKTITATGLNVQAGAFTQTVTGELYVGASGATISSGTLHILGAGTTLDAATSAGTSVTIADGARLLFENAVPRNDTGAVKITIQQGGTLEFTNMSSESHTADNALAQLKSDSYPGSVSTKTLTLTGDGTLVKSGTGSLFTVCTGASKNPVFALSKNALIDVQSGTFANGGWTGQNWSQNASRLNIAAGATVHAWDSAHIQVGGLTGDAAVLDADGKVVTKAASITSSANAANDRAGIIIGYGVDASESFTYNGNVSMSSGGKFIKTGAGTQIITGSFSSPGFYAENAGGTVATNGWVEVNQGTLTLAGSASVGRLKVATGATLNFENDVMFSNNVTLEAAEITGTLNIAKGFKVIQNAVLTEGEGFQLDLSNATALTIDGTFNLTSDRTFTRVLNGTGFVNSDKTVTLNLSANGTSSAGFTGTGKVVLMGMAGGDNYLSLTNNKSTISGGMEVKKGIIRFCAADVLDPDSGALTSSVFGTGTLTLSGGTIMNNNNAPTIHSDILLAEGTTSSFRAGWNIVMTLAGNISGKGTLQVTRDNGSILLTGTNTYSGGTEIGGALNSGSGVGRLTLGADGALGTGAVKFLSDSAWLDLAGHTQTFGGLDNSKTSGFYVAEIKNTIDGANTAMDLNFDVAAEESYSFSGTLPTINNITKSGAGSQSLSGDYTGLTSLTVNAGTMTFTGKVASGSAPVIASGGTLEFSGSKANMTWGDSFTIEDGATLRYSNTVLGNTSNLALEIASGGTLEFYSTNTGDHAAAASLTQGNYGNVTVTGSGTFKKTGSGTFAMCNNDIGAATKPIPTLVMNSDGLIWVAEGRLNLGGWVACKTSISDGTNTTYNSATLRIDSGATLDLWDAPNPIYFGALTNGESGGGTINVGNTGKQTLSLGNGDKSGTFAGTIENGVKGGTISLVKAGTGTQTLSGTATYSGTTTVNAGELVFSGTSTLTGNMNVRNGATLTFTGENAKLTTGSLTLAGSAKLNLGSANHAVTINDDGITTDSKITASNSDLKITIAKRYSGSVDVGTGTLTLDFGEEGKLSGTYTAGAYVIDGWRYQSQASDGIIASGKPITLANNGTLKNCANFVDVFNTVYVDSTGGQLMSGWGGSSYLQLSGLLTDAPGKTGGKLTVVKDYTLYLAGEVNLTGLMQVNGTTILSKAADGSSKPFEIGGLTGDAALTNNRTTPILIDVAEGVTAAYSGKLTSTAGLTKTGLGTQMFAASQSVNLSIQEGTVMISGADTKLTGTITVAQGAALTTDPGTIAYPTVPNVNFTNGGHLQITLQAADQFSRFTLAEEPEYDSENGFVDLVFVNGYQPESTSSSYVLSQSYPGGSADDLDLESWLLPTLRNEWNLLWNAGGSQLLLQRDGNALPEPASWLLFLLLGGSFPVMRRAFCRQRCGKR